MTKPTCPNGGHEKSVVLCQVIEPDTFVTGIKFYLCTAPGCRKVWDEDGQPVLP